MIIFTLVIYFSFIIIFKNRKNSLTKSLKTVLEVYSGLLNKEINNSNQSISSFHNKTVFYYINTNKEKDFTVKSHRKRIDFNNNWKTFVH